MDWVPCHLFGQTTRIPQGDQVDIPLMEPDAWSLTPEVEGRIEEGNQAYQLLRIIGQFTLFATDAAGNPIPSGTVANSNAGACLMHLWPGLQNTDGTVSVAGDTQLSVTNNEKFWWTRLVSGTSIGATPWEDNDIYTIPFWNMMDHKIGKWIAGNMTPVLSIRNTSFGPTDNELIFIQRWRMLTGRTAN